MSLTDWVCSGASLPLRIAAGSAFFAVLAAVDLARNGRRATRWREYAFLLFAVGVAMAYGALNDQITSRISWEYFYYGKELAPVLGPDVPPNPAALHRAAAKVGMEATWSAGLIAGVAILIANNPRPHIPQLPIRKLLPLLPVLTAITIAFSAILGALGYAGHLNWMSQDFRQMWETDLFHPRRFMCTYGVHLGGYIGGLVGTTSCVVIIYRSRRAVRKSVASAGT